MALGCFQITNVNRRGDIVPGAYMEVRSEADNSLADLFYDTNGLTPAPNPYIADGDGFARFFAANDFYKIKSYRGGAYREFRYVAIMDPTQNNVTGPGSSVSGNLAVWNGTDGDDLSDSGVPVLRVTKVNKKGTDVASASTIDLDSATGDLVDVTGTTTITAVTLSEGMSCEVRFTGALTLTHGASLVLPNAGSNITTAAGDAALFKGYAAGVVRCLRYQKANGQALVDNAGSGSTPLNYLSGLTLSNNGSDANNDIDVAAGMAADDGNAALMTLAASITKRLDANWAVGTNQGGLDTSSEANSTWYHVWLIQRSDTLVVDVLFSTSASSPTMPADYDRKRRIGSIYNNSSGNINAFAQFGDRFVWSATVGMVNSTNPGTSAVLATMRIPLGVKCIAQMNVRLVSPTNQALLMFSDPDASDEAPGSSSPYAHAQGNSTNAGYGRFEIGSDTSSRVRYRLSASVSDTVVQIASTGWIDFRGKK